MLILEKRKLQCHRFLRSDCRDARKRRTVKKNRRHRSLYIISIFSFTLAALRQAMTPPALCETARRWPTSPTQPHSSFRHRVVWTATPKHITLMFRQVSPSRRVFSLCPPYCPLIRIGIAVLVVPPSAQKHARRPSTPMDHAVHEILHQLTTMVPPTILGLISWVDIQAFPNHIE